MPCVQALSVNALLTRVNAQILMLAEMPAVLSWFIMALASLVDLEASDRGLSSCFKAANVQDDWAAAFIRVHKPASLEDFLYLVHSEKWESSLEGLLTAIPELKESRLVLARFKSAYRAGMDALQATKQVSIGTSEDLEQPIPEGKLSQLQRDWDQTYRITLDAHLEPSDALKGRVWREFSKRSLSVIEVKRVKSLLAQSTPSSSETVKLQDTSRGALSLSFARETDAPIKDVVSYYFALRVLMNAWAFCGNFMAKGVNGTESKFFRLAEGLDYADGCLRDAMSYGHGSVAWLFHNDMMTRGKVASKVRRGYLAGHALRESLAECHLEWRAPSPTAMVERLGEKRKASEIEGGAVPSPSKGSRLQTITMLKGGLKVCKAFNDARGCRDRKCPHAHVCDVKGCGSKDHNRLNHLEQA